MQVGLNLFSIRSLIQTEQEFLETALKLKAVGYDYLQFSGAAFDADKIARVSKESGMPVFLTHVPMERILEDTDRLMDEHAKFGCKNIGLGMMPIPILTDEAEFRRTAALLNQAAEKMEKNGFRFFYHHHHFEFLKDEHGETRMEYMLKNAPSIRFTADTYWLQYGGVSVTDYLEKLKGRIGCVHLKDYQIVCKQSGADKCLEPRFAPVGQGNIDFVKVIEQMQKSGVERYFVEQDDAVDYPDPIAEVGKSVRYLKERF